jgi:mannan endo-1,4-beta-mannosidase
MKSEIIIVLLASVLLQGCASFMSDNSNRFVKVQGKYFIINDEPYYFAGTNFWPGCYLGSETDTGGRERLTRELDRLLAMGVTNLRIAGGSENSYMNNEVQPAIQTAPGVYNEELLKGMDFLLAEMGKRNMYAVIYLNNYWWWSGGMCQYNAWADSTSIVQDNGDFGVVMDYSASFYINEKAMELFRNYIKYIVTRKNTITGEYYYNDPVIMSWQLANEPRPGRNDRWSGEYCGWIDSTARYIHSLDPNHLVSTGSEGLEGSVKSAEIYKRAHSYKSVDYMTFHLWAKNWGWYDAAKPGETYPVSEKNAVDYINQHIIFGNELNKPIVMEEFGIARDKEIYNAEAPTTIRDKYYSRLYDVVYDSAAAGSSIAGTNFWAWGGEARGAHPDNIYRQGDKFVGDPPQEPQGLNSVFDTDSSTIEIIRAHASEMRALKFPVK